MLNFLIAAFDNLLYYPLFNFLVLIYSYLPGRDFGVAIIVVTVAIRFLLYPVAAKALSSQMSLQKLQPRLREIQKKHKNDKEKQVKETLDLYKKEKVNPFSGILMALIQLPILIALYRVFWRGFALEELGYLYGFVASPGFIDPMFLNIIDLSKPNILLAVGAGIAQFFQTKMLLPSQKNSGSEDNSMAAIMQKQMVYFFPFITLAILFTLPSALGLYWTVSGIFSIVQQSFLLKNRKAIPLKND